VWLLEYPTEIQQTVRESMVKRSESVSAEPAQLALGIPNPEHFSRVAPIDETRNFGRAPRREHNFCKSKAEEVYQDALHFESHLSEFLLCYRDESCKAVRAISAKPVLEEMRELRDGCPDFLAVL
jgi:hypothetical protein